ncbi:hypothetical protein [Chryseobacterium sp. IHB B 17019]|uniref:hypothetical protein n=1 Tax=Chryseobacterium sp. IHB B 17019 TaxID=1721091 RepID=UPI0012371998|nr:hypothetical protein [Chryseobacterium sp. IHB B 17019]
MEKSDAELFLKGKSQKIENMNWTSVKEKPPEECSELVLDPKNNLIPVMTKKLIVLTDKGTVSDNKRLKMMVGEKEWDWFMSYEGETVTHWTVFKEPK